VSVQQFVKDEEGVYRFRHLICGGLMRAKAADNVLGIKLLLETKSELYLSEALALSNEANGDFKSLMTLEESLEVVVDSIPLLGESV